MDYKSFLEHLTIDDVYKIAQAANIPMQYKGTRTSILCPGHCNHAGHQDSNFGNCYLTQRGYYCFSANTSVNAIQMVQEQAQLNGTYMSFYEAAKFAALACGKTIDNQQSEQLSGLPFTTAELKTIGLNRYADISNSIVGLNSTINDTKKKVYVYNQTEVGYEQQPYSPVYINNVHLSIDMLYQKDKLQCLEFLRYNARILFKQTSAVLQELSEKPYLMETLHITKNYRLVIQELKDKIVAIKEVLNHINKEIKYKGVNNYVYDN